MPQNIINTVIWVVVFIIVVFALVWAAKQLGVHF